MARGAESNGGDRLRVPRLLLNRGSAAGSQSRSSQLKIVDYPRHWPKAAAQPHSIEAPLFVKFLVVEGAWSICFGVTRDIILDQKEKLSTRNY